MLPARHRPIGSPAPLLLLLAVFVSSSAEAIPFRAWESVAVVRASTVTLDQAPITPPTPPDASGTTGFLQANGSDSPTLPSDIDAGAIATFGVPSGYLAAGSAWRGSVDSLALNASASGEVAFIDDLTVTSPTLANGTPVVLRFSYAAAWNLDADVTGTLNTVNNGSAVARIQSGVDGMTALDPSVHLLREDLEFPSLSEAGGVFAGPPVAEYLLATAVGETFSFDLLLNTDVDGRLAFPESGSAASFLAVSFGVEPDAATPDVMVLSATLGDAFPSGALVSPTAAQDVLPLNPLAVPEPTLTALLLATLGLTRAASARTAARS